MAGLKTRINRASVSALARGNWLTDATLPGFKGAATEPTFATLIAKFSERDGREWSKTDLVEAAIATLAAHASNGARQ